MRNKVANWLRGLDGISDVSPVVVTIGKVNYEGASYVQEGSERIYLVGELPTCYRRRKATCFRFPGDERDWYIGCYWQGGKLTKSQKAYHPFGRSFALFPWTAPGAIDDGEPFRYERKSITHT